MSQFFNDQIYSNANHKTLYTYESFLESYMSTNKLSKLINLYKLLVVVVIAVAVACKGVHFGFVTNIIEDDGLSFYYPRLLDCPDQKLAVMVLSEHRVY